MSSVPPPPPPPEPPPDPPPLLPPPAPVPPVRPNANCAVSILPSRSSRMPLCESDSLTNSDSKPSITESIRPRSTKL